MRFGHTLSICIALLLLRALPLGAVNYNWDRGAGTNFWADATNWSPDGVPDLFDNLILSTPLASGSQTIDLNGTRRIISINSNGVAGVTHTFVNTGVGPLQIF